MAGEQFVFDFGASGTQQVTRAVREIQRANERAGKAAEQAAQATEDAQNALKEQRDANRELQREVKRLTKAYEAQQKRMDRLAGSTGKGATATERLNSEIKELGRRTELNALRRESKEFAKAMAKAEKESERLRRSQLGLAEDASEVDIALAQLRENTAMDKQLASSKAYKKELRAAADQQRKLDRAAQTLPERMEESLEKAEVLEGALGLVEMAFGAAVAAFEAGDIAGQMEAANREAMQLGNTLEGIQSGGGGLLSKSETGQLFGAAQLSNNNVLLRALTDPDVLSGTKGGETFGVTADLAQLVARGAKRTGQEPGAIMAALAQELEQGQAGAAFGAIGANVEVLNVQMEAHRQSARETAALYQGGLLDPITEQYALIQSGAENAQIANARFVSASSENLTRLANTFKDFKDDGFGGAIASLAGGGSDQVIGEARARIRGSVTDFLQSGASGLQSSDFLKIDEVLGQALANVKEVEDRLGSASENYFKFVGFASGLNDELREQLVLATGLSEEAVEGLATSTAAFDIEKLRSDARAIAVVRLRESLEFTIKDLDTQIDKHKRLGDVEAVRAMEAQRNVLDQKLAAAQLGTTLSEIAKIEISGTFLRGAQAAKVLGESINNATTGTQKLLRAAAGIAPTIGNALSVGLFGGDVAKAKKADKPKKPKRSGGKSKDSKADARDAILFQAGLVGKDQLDVARAEARAEFVKNLKVAEGNQKVVEASNRIFWERIRKAESAFADEAAQGSNETVRRYINAVKRNAQTIADEVAAAGARAQVMAENEAFLTLTPDERAHQAEMQRLQEQQAEKLALFKAGTFEWLQAQHAFDVQREQMQAEFNARRSERTAGLIRDAIQRSSEFDAQFQARADAGQVALMQSFDGMLAASANMVELEAQLRSIEAAHLDTGAAATASIGSIVGALAGTAAAFIKDQRARAGILALMEAAHAAAAFAVPGRQAEGVAHLIAAAKYGLVAAISPSGGGKKKAPKRTERRERRSLVEPGQRASRTGRGSGPQQITNLFVQLVPQDGKYIVRELDKSKRRGENLKIHAGMVGQPAVRGL